MVGAAGGVKAVTSHVTVIVHVKVKGLPLAGVKTTWKAWSPISPSEAMLVKSTT